MRKKAPAKRKAPPKPKAYSIKVPDVGLSRNQLSALKKAFENKIVSSLEGAPAKAQKTKMVFPPKTITQKKRRP